MVPRVNNALPRPPTRDIFSGNEELMSESATFRKMDLNSSKVEVTDKAPAMGSTTASSFPQSRKTRPDNPRSSTEPGPALLVQGWFKDNDKPELAMRPSSSHSRNRSPYSRSHLRSRSSGASLLSAPLMTRSHSTPNPHTPRPFEQAITSSPSGRLSPIPSPLRARSPSKRQEEISHPPRSPSWFENGSTSGSMAIEAIQEDSELDITPRAQSAPLSHPSPLPIHSSRSASSSLRRRPASPLHSIGINAPSPQPSFPASIIDQQTPLNMTSSGSNSPALGPQKYNEAYPSQTLHHYASSTSSMSLSFSGTSIPSTPTSARSRSPSISSLDTIEDAPEEEENKAVEEERILRLKLAAEREERGEASDGEDSGVVRRRNGSLDVPRGFGFRGGGGRERKRWSICGGERRGDLDLETIWED